MIQREITDSEKVRWTCVQAYAALEDKVPDSVDKLSETSDGKVEVVCTPSGGAQTVRLELIKQWNEKLSDEDLVKEIISGK